DDGGRVVVFAVGMASSGVPHGWAAEAGDPGVAFLPDASDVAAAELANDIHDVTDDGDIVVVSIHWGSNWGYEVPSAQVRFAHALVETGVVDVVHGHSSHHPRPIEVHRDRLILYGCGDLINDYEGIRGHERYRDDLRLLYLPTVDRASGALRELRVVPMQARRMRLEHASSQDRRWLRGTLDRVSQDLGTSLELAGDGDLAISP
ncbi:MAG: CapA family protein, partial [Nitriliruptorales bacterium]|nr:CapA family protein [Nitriliruptorales bacterium]